MTDEELFQQWCQASNNLTAWKNIEKPYRTELLKRFFDKTKEGTQRHTFQTGEALKVVVQMTRSLGKQKDVEDLYSKLAAHPELAVEVARAIEWAPKLKKKEYENLGDAARGWIDSILETKPGSPQMSLEEVKPA